MVLQFSFSVFGFPSVHSGGGINTAIPPHLSLHHLRMGTVGNSVSADVFCPFSLQDPSPPCCSSAASHVFLL